MSENDPDFHDDLLKNLETSFCEFQSKQSTQEQTYDDILKARAQIRRENYKLKQQLEKTKQNILNNALGIYFQELQQLNKENQKLRSEYRQICIGKKSSNLRLSEERNKTPKSRKSFANGCQPCLKSKMTENQDCSGRKSIKNKENQASWLKYGRNSLKSPKIRRTQKSQLTEKKNCGNSKFQSVSEIFSDHDSMRNSLAPLRASIQKGNQNKSIFTQMIKIVCQQQKLQENGYTELVEKEQDQLQYFKQWKQQKININELQHQAEESQKNIQKLTQAIETYQKQIVNMNIQTNSVTSMTKQLFSIKEELLRMQAKCQKINQFKRQLSLKEPKLEDIKVKLGKEHEKFQIRPPRSIKMMLRIYGVEEKKTRDASKCKSELKKLVKGKLDKPTQKKVKIKELLQTAREGRKKFKQLIGVYNTRITKIQAKVNHLKTKKNHKIDQ